MEWLIEIGKVVGGFGGGGIFAWYLSAKKQKAEIKGSELENVHDAITIWRETAEALKKEVETLKKEMAEQSKKINELQTDLAVVHRENTELKNFLIRKGIDYQTTDI